MGNPCDTKQSLYPGSLNDHKVLIQRAPAEEPPYVPRPVHQPQLQELRQVFRATVGRGANLVEAADPSTYITGRRGQTGGVYFSRSDDFEVLFQTLAKFFTKILFWTLI